MSPKEPHSTELSSPLINNSSCWRQQKSWVTDIKWISNKDVLYSIGMYIQYLKITYNEKESEEEYVCVCARVCVRTLCLVAHLCLTLFYPMDCSPLGCSVHGDSPGKNTGVGSHALLQGIFPIQGLSPGLPHCRWILHHLSHKGSPGVCVCVCV